MQLIHCNPNPSIYVVSNTSMQCTMCIRSVTIAAMLEAPISKTSQTQQER